MSNLLTLTPAEFCKSTAACAEGREFALTHATMAEVWDACPRPDWLIWIGDRLNKRPNDRKLRLFAAWCARFTPLGDGRVTGDLLTDPRSLAALELAERYADGQVTDAELASAAYAAAADAANAAANAYAAAYSAAADAANAAANAYAAAYSAAYSAAANAAYAAADAADADAAYAAANAANAAAYSAAADAAYAAYAAAYSAAYAAYAAADAADADAAYAAADAAARRAQADQFRRMVDNPFRP